MFALILGQKNQKDIDDSKKVISSGSESRTTKGLKSLDPSYDKIVYIPSTSPGPSLSSSPFLLQGSVKTLDILNVISRIQSVDSLCKWADLPSTKVDDLATPDNPPMWLPRSTFKTNIRKNKPGAWPINIEGNPISPELYAEYNGKLRNVDIPDNALDVVFDTWAWGASIATPDKVSTQLNSWRNCEFDLNKFERAAIGGRSVTGLAILTFIVIQVAAYGVLFVAPFFREVFNVDLGFGTLGSCGVEGCVNLF